MPLIDNYSNIEINMVSEKALRASFARVRSDMHTLGYRSGQWIEHLSNNQDYLLQKVLEMQEIIVDLERKVRLLEREKELEG